MYVAPGSAHDFSEFSSMTKSDPILIGKNADT